MSDDLDDLLLLDDDAPAAKPTATWAVLIVDDDDEVHTATRLALRDEIVLGRPLTLLHAYSRREAERLLAERTDIAVVLLDVVMEEADAGLRLVTTIREEYGDLRARIILRTGQPGYAPELEVVRRYDINDYRTKAELTQVRLVTAVTSAVRSYAHLAQLERHRAGLEAIVGASRDLVRRHGVASLAEGVLTQLAALLDIRGDGLVCAYRPRRGSAAADSVGDRFTIVGAAGGHARYVSATLSTLEEEQVVAAIRACLSERAHRFAEDHAVLYIATGHAASPDVHVEGAVYVATGAPLDREARAIVEVFAANIAAAFANVALFEHLEHLAYHDIPTGLLNRAGFLHALAASPVVGGCVALVDVADFGATCHHLGQDAGVALLRGIAARLEAHVGEAGYVARVGDDLFAVAAPNAVLSTEALRLVLAEPFSVPGAFEDDGPISLESPPTDELPIAQCVAPTQRVHVRFALGFAPLEGPPDAVLRNASVALTHGKRGGGTYGRREGTPLTAAAVFAPELEERATARLRLLRRLRRDVSARRLAVWFQPQVDLATGRLAGMEGLLRWPDGKGGFVATPDRFIPLAEQAGLIVDLGRWVLEASCEALARLRRDGLPIPRVSVNVSPHQFRSETFVDDVRRALAAHDLAGRDLELEITESVALDDPESVLATMRTLRERGVRFAIDDFGTGYSSLGHLRRLPFDVLKIDRSFIRDLDGVAQRSLVETILTLGAQMTLETVAEGIETDDHAATLRALGCTAGQGFLYAKALPIHELGGWIAARR